MALSNTLPTHTSASPALRDIKPPVVIPPGWLWLAYVLAALAGAALIYWAVRYWKRRSMREPAIPEIPPHLRARRDLEEALRWLRDPKEFCTRVSAAARTYLEARFNFHAPERTTEEFLYELQSSRLLDESQKQSLGRFLQSCDLVKFAKYEPAEPELRELHASALRLVDETEPRPLSPVAQPAGLTEAAS